jgi:hypothetical protein
MIEQHPMPRPRSIPFAVVASGNGRLTMRERDRQSAPSDRNRETSLCQCSITPSENAPSSSAT